MIEPIFFFKFISMIEPNFLFARQKIFPFFSLKWKNQNNNNDDDDQPKKEYVHTNSLDSGSVTKTWLANRNQLQDGEFISKLP